MELPTEVQCLDYFTEYKVPDNIFRHCCKVREVALFLAQQLQESKVPVHLEFVSCLAYFHDLCKMVVITDFGRNKFHQGAVITQEQEAFWKEMRERYPDYYEGEMAYKIFKDVYPELALSLRGVSSPKNENPSWEQLLVHYADLRVLREKIVTIPERLDYLHQRYPRDEEVWKKHQQKIHELEQKLFSQLSFAPEELVLEMQKKEEKNSHSPMKVKHGQ